MALTRVEKYMPDGLRALSNLMKMLAEAGAGCRVPFRMVGSWEYIGINLDGLKYWVGLYYDEPEKLWFGTRCQIDPQAAARLGVGEVTEESWVPGGYRWWRGIDLDSEPVHFFSRSKVSQMEWVEGFLRECLSQARSIETSDQPPIPEEPEEA
jgi:hypothetical protein